MPLREIDPPPEWGITIDRAAIDDLAERLAADPPAPTHFDYAGIPDVEGEEWARFVLLGVSVVWRLWPPRGSAMWSAEGLDDAPGVWHCFRRRPEALDLDLVAGGHLSDDFFAGDGVLQDIPRRLERLRDLAATILGEFGGSALAVVGEEDAVEVSERISTSLPGYMDRPPSPEGILPFDKLANLATAMLAARLPIRGLDRFGVYPDYMLPRHLRHRGVLVYTDDLARRVDDRELLEAGSLEEMGIRWATVRAGELLRRAALSHGTDIPTPDLDYWLWSEAVLGPDADAMGEHHRCITEAY